MNARSDQEHSPPVRKRNRPPITVPNQRSPRDTEPTQVEADATRPTDAGASGAVKRAPLPEHDADTPADRAAEWVEVTDSERPPPGQRSESIEAKRTPSQLPSQPILLVAGLGLLGTLLYVIALSPLQLGQLGFLAVAPWAWLVVDGRRVRGTGYVALYLCGLALWSSLYTAEIGAEIKNFASAFPLIAYLAIYLPAFVAIGRIGRRKLFIASYLWLPVVWCALEWLRSNLFGGFGLGLLGHAAVDSRRVLQITDLAGSYGLGMLMVASGSSVAELVWLTIRLRRLERAMPKAAEPPADSAAFTNTGRVGVIGLQRDRFVRGDRKSRARESLEAAMRRNRDHTRDYHVTLAAFSVLVVAGVILFSHWYGADRVAETRAWKLFESNLYELAPIAGPRVAEQLKTAAGPPGGDGLIVAATDQQLALPSSVKRQNVLLIERSQERVGDRAPGDWTACIRLRNGEQQEIKLGDGGAGNPWWASLWRQPPLRPRAFRPDPDEMPIRLMPALIRSASVEPAVNDALRAFHEQGRLIDAVVLTMEPDRWDASSWPRLASRSVMAAAVANRCPVVAMVPSGFVSVATGDGKLWWTHDARYPQFWPSADDEAATGKRTDESLRVISMIDPRSSLYVRIGDTPAIASALICLLVTMAYAVDKYRLQRVRRGQPAVA